ncbi:hypothetical protein C8R41DRAFT_921496 [Lentinula lateritia]|uniref:Ricin B lectin domain-containing protein n=1 Tax=Lentinula lateritia TaxID=40482 RepID=A0ABQ8VCN2_9AGAR|nr:hypothetical protein C8R41DRAFT_921496 [Lentinula lateritia]
MFASVTAAGLLLAATTTTAFPTARQTTCTPSFTPGVGYAVSSNINDSYVWQYNGASAGVLSAVYLLPTPPEFEPWNLTSTSTGGWTISSDSPSSCVLAPADTTLTTGSCSNAAGSDADFAISCSSCTDTSATACTLTVASTSECVNVPGDSDGNPEVRTMECTGSPQQLWDFTEL